MRARKIPTSRLLSRGRIIVVLAGVGVLAVRSLSADDASHDFLMGTRFGMSQREVRVALAKRDAQLMNSSDYKASAVEPLFTEPLFDCYLPTEKGGRYPMYMPSQEMFGERIEVMFLFEAEHLCEVTLQFRARSDSKALVAKITKSLKENYEPCEPRSTLAPREIQAARKAAWPHAYTLGFKSSSIMVDFTVNIIDPPEPTISLLLSPAR